MEKSKIMKKMTRLCFLLAEAKEIIEELEYIHRISTVSEFANVSLLDLPIPDKKLKTRFLNCVYYWGEIKTLQELLNTPYLEVSKYHNIGKKSLELAKQTIKETYGVDWL